MLRLPARGRAGWALALSLCILRGLAAAQPTPPPPPLLDEAALRRELDELRAHSEELARRLAALEVPPPPADPSSLRFRVGPGGFVLGTADGRTEIRLRAVVNLDAHLYFEDQRPLPDTFLIRRARPFVDGTLFGLIDFRILPDFAQGQAQLLDAWVELHPFRWLRLRGGRFMVPIGLEWLQRDTTTTFLERSLATDLVPWRDLGVMLSGDVGDGTFSYAVAVLNGAPDGANGPDADPASDKDFVGRVFVRPFRLWRRASFMNLGFGVAGSWGRAGGTATASGLPSYRSTSLQPIFTYLTASAQAATVGTAATAATDGAVLAAGDRWRVTPQLYWYVGPVGLLAEYVISSQRVAHAGTTADLVHHAWNLTASFVLTLERASYDGVVPRHPIDFRHRAFGAFELTFRYSELRFDERAFPDFADPATSVRTARELAAGLNWYLTDLLKIMVSFHRTDFTGGASTGDREPENALMLRLQLAL